MNSTVKTALLWVVIIVLVFLLWSLFQTTKGTSEKIAFSTFVDRVNANQVDKVTIRGDSIRGEFRATAPGGKREFEVTGPPGPYPRASARTSIRRSRRPRRRSTCSPAAGWRPRE